MAQPQTMEELVESIIRTNQQVGSGKVIGTLATRSLDELPQSQRVIALGNVNRHLAAANDMTALEPGTQFTLNGQTDHWYQQHDQDNIFTALMVHIQTIGQRTR